MPNAKRPPMNKDASPMAPAGWMPSPTVVNQPHDNMAPFKPAPVENDTAGGHYSKEKLLHALDDECEGTGRY